MVEMRVFGLRCSELGDQLGERHDFVLAEDAHQLEARVRELEGALRKIAAWDFLDLDYRNAQDAALAALRTDHQGGTDGGY